MPLERQGESGLKVLMVFVDGLGLGEQDPEVNPLYRGRCPRLLDLLENHAKPIDARLGVEGLPQSATGQAALFTGENAPRLLGRHKEGLPGPTLKELVREHNLYRKVQDLGRSATFANAYFIEDQDEVRSHRRPSVSTVAALDAFGAVRDRADLEANRAVYQDLTRYALNDRGYQGPILTAEQAAQHLAALAADHDFTLFEYFQTDLQAHRGSDEQVLQVLEDVDGLVATLVDLWLGPDRLLLLVSDHGNIEDVRTRSHTLNPIPWVVLGEGGDGLHEVNDLTDITPALVRLFSTNRGDSHD